MLSRDFILKAKDLRSSPCAMCIHGFAALCKAGACAWSRAGSHSPHWGNLKNYILFLPKSSASFAFSSVGHAQGNV